MIKSLSLITILTLISCSKAGLYGPGSHSTKSTRAGSVQSQDGDILGKPEEQNNPEANPEKSPEERTPAATNSPTQTPPPGSPTPAPTCAPEAVIEEDSGSWRSSTDQSPAARAGQIATFVPGNLIVWGGNTDYHGASTNQGFSFNEVSQRSTLISGINQPSARVPSGGVTVGSNLIVWGSNDFFTSTGGIYSSTSNSWVSTSLVNPPSQRKASLVLTNGSKVFVWGGVGCIGGLLNDGAILDPTTNTWEQVPSSPVLAGRYSSNGVWTGTEYFIWSGSGNGSSGYFSDGALYNPATKTWRAVSSSGAPSGTSSPIVVLSGSEVIVWGSSSTSAFGAIFNPATNSWRPMSANGNTNSGYATGTMTNQGLFTCGYYSVGGVNCNLYSTANNSWTSFTGFPNMIALGGYTMNYSNNKVYVYGGYRAGTGSIYSASMHIFDLSSKSWTSLTPNLPVEYSPSSAQLLTGGLMNNGSIFVYGPDLWNQGSTGSNYGAYLINPSDLSKRPANLSSLPPLKNASVMLSEKYAYLWGVEQRLSNAALLYRYNSQTDSTDKIAATGSLPEKRQGQGSAASLTHLFIWSGLTELTATWTTAGSLFNIATQSWSDVSQVNVPAARANEYVTWTGKEFLVYGGNRTALFFDGGLYNPVTNTWRTIPAPPVDFSTSTQDATSAIWGGGRLYVFGTLKTGGAKLVSYSPDTNTWTTHGSDKIPYARGYASLIWTEKGVIVWGGVYSIYSGDYSPSGGYYDIASDKWIRLSSQSDVGGVVGLRGAVTAWANQKAIFVSGIQGGMYTTTISAYQPGF